MQVPTSPDAQNRSVLRIAITGASSGLGAGLARDYAAPGISLALFARRLSRLEEVAGECRALGAMVEIAALDVGYAEPLGSLLEAQQIVNRRPGRVAAPGGDCRGY